MTQYYDEVSAASEGKSASRNGWRYQLMQYLRYEIAAEKSGLGRGDTLIDLGCGSADLEHYLRRWWKGCYTGIDRRDSVLPGDEKSSSCYVAGDFMDEEATTLQPHDIGCAIGALVDGRSRGERARRAYIHHHLDRVHQLGGRGWVVIALEQDGGRGGQHLRLDPCLQGIRKEELHQWCRIRGLEVETDNGLIPGEWVISWRDCSTKGSETMTPLDYYEAALEGFVQLHGKRPRAVDEAHYWVALERYKRAIQALKRCDRRTAEARLIEARISLATQGQ